MPLTKQELLGLVIVHDKNNIHVVRLQDIPNPYRSEFAADMYYSARPIIEGEAWCYYVDDWTQWVRRRFKNQYELHNPEKYIELTDEDVLHEPLTDELWAKIVKDITNDKTLYIEKCENGVFIKYGNVIYWERDGQILFKHEATYVKLDRFLFQLNSIFESFKLVESGDV